MARIRDLLRLADGQRDEADVTLPMPRAFTPTISPECEEAIPTEEVPFIEVGGKNQPMEGSSAVLAASIPSRPSFSGPSLSAEQPAPAAMRFPALEKARGFNFTPLPSQPPPLQPPSRRFATELVAYHQPDHSVSLMYRQLLAAIEAQLPASQSHVVLFAGLTAEVDTTTVILNTAISRAQREGGTAIVVDADLRHPCIHERLGLFAEPGLRDVLLASASLQRALQATAQSNLYALTAGLAKADDPCLIAGQAMRAILRHLRERFNLTFIDAPHWDGRADLVSLAGVCDAVYLVLPESDTETQAVKDLTQIITLEGVSLRGCISVPR